jgi:hypothetical protein
MPLSIRNRPVCWPRGAGIAPDRPGPGRTWDGLKALIALVEDVRVVGAGPERDVALAEALVLAVDLLAVAADA